MTPVQGDSPPLVFSSFPHGVEICCLSFSSHLNGPLKSLWMREKLEKMDGGDNSLQFLYSEQFFLFIFSTSNRGQFLHLFSPPVFSTFKPFAPKENRWRKQGEKPSIEQTWIVDSFSPTFLLRIHIGEVGCLYLENPRERKPLFWREHYSHCFYLMPFRQLKDHPNPNNLTLTQITWLYIYP